MHGLAGGIVIVGMDQVIPEQLRGLDPGRVAADGRDLGVAPRHVGKGAGAAGAVRMLQWLKPGRVDCGPSESELTAGADNDGAVRALAGLVRRLSSCQPPPPYLRGNPSAPGPPCRAGTDASPQHAALVTTTDDDHPARHHRGVQTTTASDHKDHASAVTGLPITVPPATTIYHLLSRCECLAEPQS